MSQDLHQRAHAVLQQGVRSPHPVLRANAIEMLQFEVEPLRDAVGRGLVDTNEGVRFVAAMSVGQSRLCGVAHLVEPLLLDPSPSVQAAAMYALSRCGRVLDLTPLASMVVETDRRTRGNAAMVLGGLGNPSAAPLLREVLSRPVAAEDTAVQRMSELEVAEALVQLGDRQQLETIRAAFYAPAEQAELTALAAQISGRIGDRVMLPALGTLALAQGPRQAGPELRLIAAEAVARIAPEMAMPELGVTFSASELPEVRAQAAIVMGWGTHPQVGRRLSALLDDPDPQVQLAAAGSVLRRMAPRGPVSGGGLSGDGGGVSGGG